MPLITNNLSAVIFDMDGVLVDSEPVHLESTIRMMRNDFGLPFTSEDNQEFLGSTDRHMYDVLKKRHALQPSRDELIARRKSIYLSLLKEKGIPWRDGIRELIAELPSHGFQVALASSGLKPIVDLTLNGGDIARHFSAIVTGDDILTPKPAPDIYLDAARKLSLPPSACMAIEDTDVGVRAAKTAGMSVIAFPAASTAHMDFTVADHVVGSVGEIRALLLGRSR